jgi:hypothetical protein
MVEYEQDLKSAQPLEVMPLTLGIELGPRVSCWVAPVSGCGLAYQTRDAISNTPGQLVNGSTKHAHC